MLVMRPVTVGVQTPVILLATRTVIITTAIQRPVVTLRSIATQTATTHVTVHVTHCLVNVVTNCSVHVVADRANKACDTNCDNGQCDSAACDDCPTGQSCDALIGKCRDGLFATRRCKPVTMNFCSSGCDTACDSNGCDSACDSNGCDSACDSNGKCGLFGNRCGKGGTGCFAGFLSGQGRGSCCGNSCSNGGCQGSTRASCAMAGCACGSPKCNGSCGRGFGIADCFGAGCGLQHCRSCLSLLHGRHGFGLHGGGSHPYGGEIPHTANPAGMYGMQGGNPAPNLCLSLLHHSGPT